MLALQLLTGTALDLYPDTSLPLNFTNPIFDPQRIDRAWSYPLSIPRTPRNVLALKGAGRIDAVSQATNLGANLIVEGVPIDTGVVRVRGNDKENIKVVFQNQSIDLATKLAALKLRDLSIPIEVATPLQPTIFFEALRPVGLAAELRIRINGILYIENFQEPQRWIDTINEAYPGLFTLTASSTNQVDVTLNPIDGLNLLEIETITDLDANPENNARPAFLELVDLNYATEATRITNAWQQADKTSDDVPFRFPTMHLPSFFDGKNPGTDGIANRYDGLTGRYVLNDFPGEEGGWPENFLPQPRVASLIEKALESLGFRLTGSLADNVELRELLLFNNHNLDIFLRTLGPQLQTDVPIGIGGVFFEDFSWIVPRPSFNLADHCPDLTAMDLLLLFAESFAHVLLVEPGQLRTVSIAELLRAAPEDWTSKIDPDPNSSVSDRKSIALDYNRQGDENIFPGQLERVVIGSESEQNEYIIPVFPPFEQLRDVAVGEATARVRIPTIDEVGRNEFYDLGNEPRRRLFFHRGLQPDAGGRQQYPQSGYSLKTFSANPWFGYALSWDGEGNLYDRWWGSLIRLMQHGRTDRRIVTMTVADLLELKKWRNVRKYYRTEDGTAVGVIRSVRVNASVSSGLGLADVTFMLEPS